MVEDARFEDGRETPLNLGALSPEDLQVLSALVQDAVTTGADMRWIAADRRFVALLNRFRWEDEGRVRHGPERVRALLVIDNVLGVAGQGIERGDSDTVLSLLSLSFEPDPVPPGGHLVLTFAGDGALRLRVEAPEAVLRDVTRPYSAPSGKVPTHDD